VAAAGLATTEVSMKRLIRRIVAVLAGLLLLVIILLALLTFVPGLRQWALDEYVYRQTRRYVDRLEPARRDSLVAYLSANAQPPEAYVLSKFRTQDIVFLGEFHRIRHDVLFVRSLVGRLLETGVTNLGLELAAVSAQPLLDSLMALPAYDRSLARRILWTDMGGWWPYEEYLDLFRAAWEANARRPEGSPPLRVLALIPDVDWDRLYHGTEEERQEERRRGPGMWDSTMARVLIREVLDRGEKALVYCGIHHAFRGFRQPVVSKGEFVRFGDPRAGNIVDAYAPGRAFTIALHAPWADYENPFLYYLPFRGALDQIFRVMRRPMGFDLVPGTPVGDLASPGCPYEKGYERFTAATIYDGYVMLKDLAEYEGVAVAEDWIQGPEDLQRLARTFAGPVERAPQTKESFEALAARSCDMQMRFRAAIRALDWATR
jgi:hypothetical protein